jgi:hypothetical protein
MFKSWESSDNEQQVLRLKENLSKMMGKFDSFELCKSFRVELVCSVSHEDMIAGFLGESGIYTKRRIELDDLRSLEVKLKRETESDEAKLNEEVEKRKKYRVIFNKINLVTNSDVNWFQLVLTVFCCFLPFLL